MTQEENPVKDLLFNYIKDTQESIASLVSEKKFDKVVRHLLEGCYDGVVDAGDESVSILATGILHYVLTVALVPSQRKVDFQGVEIDIVVPDLRVLEADARKALVIHVFGTRDPDMIKDRLGQLQKIQPEAQNIWLVIPEDLGLDAKTYTVSKNGSTLPKMIRDIVDFADSQDQSKLRILRI